MSDGYLEPNDDRILIKPLGIDRDMNGQILMPDNKKQDGYWRGLIVAAGPGRMLESGARAPMRSKVGDVILFPAARADKLQSQGGSYLLLLHDSQIAIFIREGTDPNTVNLEEHKSRIYGG